MTGKALDIRKRAKALTLPFRKSQHRWLLRRRIARNTSLQNIEQSETRCQNCGEDLRGPFCHACGQQDRNLLRPWWALFHDLMDSLLDVDNRIVRSVLVLMLMPGQMTRDYMRGHRARFVTPIKMYLFVTVAFFLALEISGAALVQLEFNHRPRANSPGTEAMDTLLDKEPSVILQEVGELDDVSRAELHAAFEKAELDPADLSEENIVALQEALPGRGGTNMQMTMFLPAPEDGYVHPATSDVKNWITGSGDDEEFASELSQRVVEILNDPVKMNETFSKWLPRAMVLLVPIFALMVRTMHWGKGRYYVNQLVYSLHFHTFLFALMILLIWVVPRFGTGIGGQIFLFGAGGWLLVSLKVSQNQGWIRTIFKSFWLASNYMIVAGVMVVGITIWAFVEDTSVIDRVVNSG